MLDPAAVARYHAAVNESTRSWLVTADLAILDRVIGAPAALARVGGEEDGFAWLHRM